MQHLRAPPKAGRSLPRTELALVRGLNKIFFPNFLIFARVHFLFPIRKKFRFDGSAAKFPLLLFLWLGQEIFGKKFFVLNSRQ
jgi:hypothetical protein